MAFTITKNARIKAERNNISPNLVFKIDGLDTLYGLQIIKKYIRIGDPGLFIGSDWVIGGLRSASDQVTNITFEGTTTQINQKLDPDKASGATISTMDIALIDIDGSVSDLVSPGVELPDILGRKAKVFLGFADTAWPEDYITIFRGIIDQVDVGTAKMTFKLSHPDQKKRQDIFVKGDTELNGAIDNVVTTITVDSTADFFSRVLGPDGVSYDSNIKYGVRIDDEIIFFTGKTGTTFTGCTRGALGTTAASHSDNAAVSSFYNLTGNSIDLALKLYFSGRQGPWVEDIEVKHINQLGDLSFIQNALFFDGVDIQNEYGISINDYVTITGATNGANDVTRTVDLIEKTDEGSYLILSGANLISENDSPAEVSFRSQYDTLADGLRFDGDEVDVVEHERIKRIFLSSHEQDFRLKDTIQGKDFIEEQILFPAAAYSLPRKSQSSLGYHIGPIPGVDPKIFTSANAKNASQVKISRSINKNFYNTIVYRYDESLLEDAKFTGGYITTDATSKTEIPVGTRALVITAKGMRSTLSALNLATTAAARRLKRYKRGAEYISQFEVLYGDSYNIEIGDIIIIDTSDLKMLDTKLATRSGDPKLYEIINKTFDIKTGGVKLELVDTNYSTNTRYCLISPSSRIETGGTTTKFKLKVDTNNPYGIDEGKKWSRYIGATIRVRSDDFTTRNDTSTILSVSGNTITLDSALSFTPQDNDTMTFSVYDDSNDTLKLIYGWMRNLDFFADGKKRYEMIG